MGPVSGTAIDTVPGALHAGCGPRRPAPAFRGVRRTRRVLAAALLAGACGGSGGADVDAVVVATLELGMVLVGIGDLQQPERVDDPAAPNGKPLALDPDGHRDQRPPARSLGWNYPL